MREFLHSQLHVWASSPSPTEGSHQPVKYSVKTLFKSLPTSLLSPSWGLLKVRSFAFLFVLSALKILGNFTKLRVIAWVLFWCLHILLPVQRPQPHWVLRQQLHIDNGRDSQKQNRFAGTTTPEHNLLLTGLQHPTSPLQHCSSVISSFVVVLRQPCC